MRGLTYVRLFQRARLLGYQIELHYLWLSSAVQAIARVRQRVEKGGHGVPAADIRRRFTRSLANLLNDYLPLADRWAVWDNRGRLPRMLASSSTHGIVQVKQVLFS